MAAITENDERLLRNREVKAMEEIAVALEKITLELRSSRSDIQKIVVELTKANQRR